MKIATFNINSIRERLPRLLDWLARAQPDVVCLQELRIRPGEFPREAIAGAGYGALWQAQSTRFNGVAILARDAEPVEVRRELPGDAADTQARYLEAAVNGVLVGCLYAPNGNPQPGPKFAAKLAWHRRFEAHAAALLQAEVPVVLAGDYNIVPTSQDIYATSSYADNALVQPASREAWDYMRKRWERNAGLRIDHLLLSPSLAPRLREAGVDRDERDLPGASDHAPVWIRLGPPARPPARAKAARK